MRPTILLTILALAIAGGTANAQNTLISPDGQRLKPGQVTRVNVQMQITGSASAVSAEEQLASPETMRRAIYQMSSKECAALGEAFKTDCRMVSLNVNNSARGGRYPQNEPVVSATAVYELSKAAD